MRDVLTPEQARIHDALVRSKKQTWEQATVGTLVDFRCEYCKIDFLDPTHPDTIANGSDGTTLSRVRGVAPTTSTILYVHVGSAIGSSWRGTQAKMKD